MISKRLMTVAALILLSLGLSSCERTRIGDITADPGSFRNKQVNIAGEVVNSMGASLGSFSKGVYEVSDGTGTLWVYSDTRGVPAKGARVGVRGQVQQSVTVLGRNFGTVLRESDRHIDRSVR